MLFLFHPNCAEVVFTSVVTSRFSLVFTNQLGSYYNQRKEKEAL